MRGSSSRLTGESAGHIWGPQYIKTTNLIQSGDGSFSQTVPVTQADNYKVTFSDAKGQIGTITFQVTAPTTVTTAPVTTVTTKMVTTTKTAALTPIPTTTKSPLPAVIVMGAIGIAALLIFRMKSGRE